MKFLETMKQHDLEEAYKILKELEPELNKENFLKSIDHEFLKNHKLQCSHMSLEKGLNLTANCQEKYMEKYVNKLLLPLKFLAIILVIACTTVFAQTRQEHVHQMAHSVMPFDVSQTIHFFKMTESGGVQRVIAKDPGATDQIALIRQHLQHEAERFQHGDYSDPAMLHGADMPGLEDLEKGASRIKVSYAALPSGAEIMFETTDLRLLTAVHRWFGAQLSEHGADARSE